MKNTLLLDSFEKGLYGGSMGSLATFAQVGGLMWLRTTINYQYKHGGTFSNTFKLLYKQGGIPRFYRGVFVAIIQAPLSRFGDTAMNTGVLHYLNNNDSTKEWNMASKTFYCSLFSGLWRVNLMPIDTLKSSLQVNNKEGVQILKNKISNHGFRVLYNGGLGAFSASMMGHFPWFFTHNYLSSIIPISKDEDKISKYSKYALIGFSSSFVSDIVSNSFRVLKIYKQTDKNNISYYDSVKEIVRKHGISNLFTRGLKTKILTNGIQSVLFTILWKSLL